MRFSLVILLATLLYGSPNLMAKNMAMEISYAEFMNAENQAYLELYFALHSHSVDYKALPDGGFRGGVEITVSLYRDSTLKAADRFRLLSPELEDTLNLGQVFIHQLRFPVNSGTYLVRFDLVDVNDPSETYQVSQTITTHLGGNELMTSELLLLDSYKKAEEKNAFTRSGYNLIPQITSGTPYFNDSVNQISFYSEIYNTQQSLGDGEPYLVKYYLKDADRNQVLQAYGSFSRKKASQVEPVLAAFSIENLPTGNYILCLDVLNKLGDTLASRNKFFYRQNQAAPIANQDLSQEELLNSFVGSLGGLDSIYQFIKYLYPISTDAQRKYQQELLAQKELADMKSYFYAFWKKQNPPNPARAWESYYHKVRVANSKFRSSLRPGYRTDRGRVFLVYGKPDMIDSRKLEPNMPAYEMWQYNLISTPYSMRQTNRLFVFAEFEPSTNEYQLFHSTAIGELSSRRWRYDMKMRYSGASGNINSQRDMGYPTDPFGTRTEDNIIINSTGSDRENR